MSIKCHIRLTKWISEQARIKLLGDEILTQIAKELVEAVRKNATIDCTVKRRWRTRAASCGASNAPPHDVGTMLC